MPTYCEADGCENEATQVVPVSIDADTVDHRRYCSPCSEAYHTGAQHGMFRAVRQLRAHVESLREEGFVTEAGVLFAALSKLDSTDDPGDVAVEPPTLEGSEDQ